eukprot:TRINITY_DN42879_c0_g1_i3.p1 TRINITY_DN42879_c0_g1~~TRINITY_DN42879_c0_g1_i3.p1  ORF type:complete len:537 (-),score=67.44 TRINITY_DN42879_c0_g1_i3:314-1924(-)
MGARCSQAFGNKKQNHVTSGLSTESQLTTTQEDTGPVHQNQNARGHYQFGYDKGFEQKYQTTNKQLGKGSFGVIKECIKRSTGEVCACKMIAKSKLKHKEAVGDVIREVKILRTLNGRPNVVKLHDVFEDHSNVYIIMELCTGGELFEQLVARKRYTERDASIVIRQIANVVADCHLNGVIHRDLKPENFLFSTDKPDAPLKAIDFGLSTFFEPNQKFNDVVGSAYYVAPEVLYRSYGPACDLWSIGVIMYILLAGRPPFYSQTEAGVFKKIMKGRWSMEHEPWPVISSTAKDLLKKLLISDPKARITAAQALSHKWLRGDQSVPDIPLDFKVLNSLKDFAGASRLRRFLRKVAEQFDEQEIVSLRDQFLRMDTDGDGSITYKEMVSAVSKMKTGSHKKMVIPETEVKDIVAAIDEDHNGEVDYLEFVAASLHVHQLIKNSWDTWKKRTRMAFDSIDQDGNGYIDPEELEKEIGGGVNVHKLIEEVDRNKDGKIDYNEFCSLLIKKATLPAPLYPPQQVEAPNQRVSSSENTPERR